MAAFGGQRAEVERFRERLVDARKAGVLRGLMTAVGCAAFWFVFYASYGLGFWYGVKLILDEREACGGGDEQCRSAVRYDPSSLIKVGCLPEDMTLLGIGKSVIEADCHVNRIRLFSNIPIYEGPIESSKNCHTIDCSIIRCHIIRYSAYRL